jgi:hypothetical protein
VAHIHLRGPKPKTSTAHAAALLITAAPNKSSMGM